MALVPNQQEDTCFFYGKGNENMNRVQVFLYIRETYQQLRGLSLLVIGCQTYC
jgi:hypothetical protein